MGEREERDEDYGGWSEKKREEGETIMEEVVGRRREELREKGSLWEGGCSCPDGAAAATPK